MKMAKQQLSILLDRTAHGFPPLSADIVEAEQPKLKMAICKAELNDSEAFLAYSYLAKPLLDGSLKDVWNVIEREAIKDMLIEGLKSLVVEFQVRNHGFEERMSKPGFMDQLQSDVENWSTRRDEFEKALFRLDIQAAGDLLSGIYSPEDVTIDDAVKTTSDWARESSISGKVPGGFVGFCYMKIDVMATEERDRFISVNKGDSSFFDYRNAWNKEWSDKGNTPYKKPQEGISKAKKIYRELHKELKN